jgi:hypothetical protein
VLLKLVVALDPGALFLPEMDFTRDAFMGTKGDSEILLPEAGSKISFQYEKVDLKFLFLSQ